MTIFSVHFCLLLNVLDGWKIILKHSTSKLNIKINSFPATIYNWHNCEQWLCEANIAAFVSANEQRHAIIRNICRAQVSEPVECTACGALTAFSHNYNNDLGSLLFLFKLIMKSSPFLGVIMQAFGNFGFHEQAFTTWWCINWRFYSAMELSVELKSCLQTTRVKQMKCLPCDNSQ